MSKQELAPFIAQSVGITKEDMKRFGIGDPDKLVALAKEVEKYVRTNGLTETIQKKEYVLVEGWQFAGSLLGLVGKIVDYKNESSYDPVTFEYNTKDWSVTPPRWVKKKHATKYYKYFAQAHFVDGDGKEVSNGFAMCSNEEVKKYTFDEYAILSMAQTRALGKAARMSFAFLMKAAGYQPTPAEEMPDLDNEDNATVNDPLPEDIENQILVFTDSQSLIDWVNEGSQAEYYSNMNFVNAVRKQISILDGKNTK